MAPVARSPSVVLVGMLVSRLPWVFDHELDAVQDVTQLVHALDRLLKVSVAREIQPPERSAQLLAVERREAVFGVVG